MSTKNIENPDTFRSNICKKLSSFFSENMKHATNLEKGIYNWALKEATNRKVVKKWDNQFFIQIYLDHLRSIFVNLRNDKLVQMVLNGEIKAHEWERWGGPGDRDYERFNRKIGLWTATAQ